MRMCSGRAGSQPMRAMKSRQGSIWLSTVMSFSPGSLTRARMAARTVAGSRLSSGIWRTRLLLLAIGLLLTAPQNTPKPGSSADLAEVPGARATSTAHPWGCHTGYPARRHARRRADTASTTGRARYADRDGRVPTAARPARIGGRAPLSALTTCGPVPAAGPRPNQTVPGSVLRARAPRRLHSLRPGSRQIARPLWRTALRVRTVPQALLARNERPLRHAAIAPGSRWLPSPPRPRILLHSRSGPATHAREPEKRW